MSVTAEKSSATAIRPFQIDIPDETLEDLRRRVGSVRCPSRELVDDRSQGVQLATIGALARYWVTEYDWRRCEAKLNALPQFKTEIDGEETHFIHVKSRHEDALPLIMTHGWPGSVIELLEAVGPLTDPTEHAGSAEDAFDLVLPSIPGHGFSAEPTELSWSAGRVAQAWPVVMHRLGYSRYVAQGGNQGAAVSDAMGRQSPEGLIGIHLNLLVPALGNASAFPTKSDEERAAADALATFRASGFGYFLEQATRLQTIGYALLDPPLALAAWMLDHDTDSYYKISRAFVDGQPSGNLTRDHILDNITTYWLTGTGASAARSCWEGGQAAARCGRAGSTTRLGPRRIHHVPRRDLPDPAQRGRAGVPQPQLLQRRRQGRPLRRLGRARTVRDRSPRRVPTAPLAAGRRSPAKRRSNSLECVEAVSEVARL